MNQGDLGTGSDSGSQNVIPAATSPHSAGLSLPTQRHSVTLPRRVSLTEDEQRPDGSRRDSLDKTKAFYNVRPNSPPSQSPPLRHVHRGPSRQDTRPLSPDTSSMPKSPPRSAVPLHIPRGFLTPKKPAAALRLEQQMSKDRRPSAPSIGTPSNDPLQANYTSKDPLSNDSISLDAILAGGPREEADVPRSRTVQSIAQTFTDMSTPPPLPRDLSSDDLVYGRQHDVEKSGNSVTFAPRKRTKRYKRLENTQMTWLFGGRAMTGGDNPWSVLLTVTILLGLTGVWLGTTGAWLWRHGTEYGLAPGGGIAIVIVFVYLFGIVFSSLLAAALRDPGIIPRGLDPEPPLSQVESWWEADNREMMVKTGKVVVKYCETCKTYRPPRSSHCRLCGNCVDGIDHHCSYLHTCVGKRNYLAFLVLLISATISDIYIVVFSAIHFSLLCSHDNISFKAALQDSPGAAVSFLLGVLVLPAICFLLWYHIRLLLYNLTTVEQIRASASSNLLWARKRPDNPFAADSTMSNVLLASLGRPQFPSWIDASGWYEEDTREVNPVLTDPKWFR